nr:hypothetical protein [Thermobacillus sp.]
MGIFEKYDAGRVVFLVRPDVPFDRVEPFPQHPFVLDAIEAGQHVAADGFGVPYNVVKIRLREGHEFVDGDLGNDQPVGRRDFDGLVAGTDDVPFFELAGGSTRRS